jgi:drug/metabolite transporter (DMT)-like permease
MKVPIQSAGVSPPDKSGEIPAERQPPLDLWPTDAGNESVYHDRRFSTLNITDEGVREASAADFLFGPPIQRVVRAIQEFDAWHALPVFLLAGFCLTSLDTTAKYLVREHSILVVVWARYLGQMLIVTPIAWNRCGRGFWRTRRLPMQLLRSVMLLGATVFFFGGLRYLPLAEGSAILFLAPVFIVIFSGRILGERPTRARWIASITGFVGVLVLLRPGSAILHPAALLMFGAALCNAFYHMLTRKLTNDDVYTTLFYSALLGTVVLSLTLPWGAGSLGFNLQDTGLFLLLGLLAGLGHWFLIAAYVMAPASSLTAFTYVQMIWALMYGYLIFGQLPDRWSAVGIAVIVLSGVVLAAMERRRSYEA